MRLDEQIALLKDLSVKQAPKGELTSKHFNKVARRFGLEIRWFPSDNRFHWAPTMDNMDPTVSTAFTLDGSDFPTYESFKQGGYAWDYLMEELRKLLYKIDDIRFGS